MVVKMMSVVQVSTMYEQLTRLTVKSTKVVDTLTVIPFHRPGIPLADATIQTGR